MSHEQQRIAIAKACGWTDFNSAAHAGAIQYGRRPFSCFDSWELPDYLNDLNAMHEAEKHAIIGPIVRGGKSLLAPYCEMLEGVAEDKESAMVATAAQRAEAFLKTLDLWKP